MARKRYMGHAANSSDYMKERVILLTRAAYIHGTGWKGNPKLGILQSWDPKQDEGHRDEKSYSLEVSIALWLIR